MVAIGMLLAFVQTPSFAQAPATSKDRPSFEVATIKPNDPSNHMLSGTRGSATRPVYIGSLRSFIKLAYSVEDVQLSGGPPWLDRDIYEIDALTSAPASRDQQNLMLQSLLADRFKLALHEDTKLLPVYSLVPAKSGPKLQPADSTGPSGSSSGPGMLRGTMDMPTIAKNLTSLLSRTTTDNTGLKGMYKLDLKWTPDEKIGADNGGVSIFTAIQEQLGLRLEPAKGPVRVLVVDKAEKPSPN